MWMQIDQTWDAWMWLLQCGFPMVSQGTRKSRSNFLFHYAAEHLPFWISGTSSKGVRKHSTALPHRRKWALMEFGSIRFLAGDFCRNEPVEKNDGHHAINT